ncbi:MAG: hypothetical protein IPN06_06615 [Burkholderiales bacterium]|nr:hypothetical protein [Burkholderiales bacterium]
MKVILIITLALAALAPAFGAEMVRCTAADKSYSYLRKPPCPMATDVQTQVSATKPLMAREPSHKGPVKCTSHDGKRESIQSGNCADPTDYQQRLGDR